MAALKWLIANGKRKSGKVPCFVTGEKNNTETRLDLIMLNATQRKYSDADTMREYEELTRIFKELETDGKPIKGRIRDKIAGALNVSAAQVGKMDNIKHNAIPDVEKAVKSGDMSISTANEVAKLSPEKQQKIIAEKPKITHKEVKQIQKEAECPEVKAEEEIEEDTEMDDTDDIDDTDRYEPVVLSKKEAETLSRYIGKLVISVMGEDYAVLNALADRLAEN